MQLDVTFSEVATEVCRRSKELDDEATSLGSLLWPDESNLQNKTITNATEIAYLWDLFDENDSTQKKISNATDIANLSDLLKMEHWMSRRIKEIYPK